MWLSLVERLVWDQDAAGSNPVIPTNILGCRQAVRHSTLTAAFRGSNPLTPAIRYLKKFRSNRLTRQAREVRLVAGLLEGSSSRTPLLKTGEEGYTPVVKSLRLWEL